MFGEEQTRAMLSAADPVQGATVPGPLVPATALIARAESAEVESGRFVPTRTSRPARRLLLVAAAATVAAGATVALLPALRPTEASPTERGSIGSGSTVAGSGATRTTGTVLVPIAYQIGAGAPDASSELRKLSKTVTAAPYDQHSGRYTYTRQKVWGDPIMSSEDGYLLSYVHEDQTWTAADGSGRQRVVLLAPEFPDQESRDYWTRLQASPTSAPTPTGTPGRPYNDLPARPDGVVPLPTDRTGMAQMLGIKNNADSVDKRVSAIYGHYAVSRQSRALILDVLADVPGFRWRGRVTDRAGRAGVAITADAHGTEAVLIFDPSTGALLAHEIVALQPKHKVSTYLLYLGYDRTDRLG